MKYLLSLLLVLLASVASAQTPTNTPKPTVTNTPVATNTPKPTATATVTVGPTKTPKPTPAATATKKPTVGATAAKTAADGRKAVLSPTFSTKQDEYFLAHGRYFQGIPWSLAPPADGDNVLTSNLQVTPYYQAEDWIDTFPGVIQDYEPSRMYIHQYDGPQGKGWVLCWEIKTGPDTLQQCENHGPEAYRTIPWTRVTPLP